mmetsp:Transcript_40472/g.133348  ORF Transcript_40472/g.133348 Transcript_40472/m.133348 type:complete len:539 (+) Transcript_40472:1135-2751(+)
MPRGPRRRHVEPEERGGQRTQQSLQIVRTRLAGAKVHPEGAQVGAVLCECTQHAAIDRALREGDARQRGAAASKALDEIGGGEAGGAVEEEGSHAVAARAHQLVPLEQIGSVPRVLKVHVDGVNDGRVPCVLPPVARWQPVPQPLDLPRSGLVLVLRCAPIQDEREHRVVLVGDAVEHSQEAWWIVGRPVRRGAEAARRGRPSVLSRQPGVVERARKYQRSARFGPSAAEDRHHRAVRRAVLDRSGQRRRTIFHGCVHVKRRGTGRPRRLEQHAGKRGVALLYNEVKRGVALLVPQPHVARSLSHEELRHDWVRPILETREVQRREALASRRIGPRAVRDRIAHHRDVSPLRRGTHLPLPLLLAHRSERGGIGGGGGGGGGGTAHTDHRPTSLKCAHDIDTTPARRAARAVSGDHFDASNRLRRLRRGLLELIPRHAAWLSYCSPIAPDLLGELAIEGGEGDDHITALRVERLELDHRGRRQPAARHVYVHFRTPTHREAHHRLGVLRLAIGIGLREVGRDAARLRRCACECQTCWCL